MEGHRFEVKLAARAETDIDLVLHWFVRESARIEGNAWLSRLRTAITTLEQYPLRCSLAAEAAELGIELRELRIGRGHGVYRLLFIVQEGTVQILHIRHGARDVLDLTDIDG